jgi:hypothetical protein
MTKKPSTSIGAMSPDDTREVKKRVLGNNRQSSQLPSHTGTHDLGWHYCILLEDLAPATNPLTGYTQAEANIIFYAPNVSSLDMTEITNPDKKIVVTNRSISSSATAGDAILVRWINREWAPSISAGGVKLFHGIIVSPCDPVCSTYRVQRIHRYLTAECDDCASSSS